VQTGFQTLRHRSHTKPMGLVCAQRKRAATESTTYEFLASRRAVRQLIELNASSCLIKGECRDALGAGGREFKLTCPRKLYQNNTRYGYREKEQTEMKQTRFNAEQIIAALKQLEAGQTASDLAPELPDSDQRGFPSGSKLRPVGGTQAGHTPCAIRSQHLKISPSPSQHTPYPRLPGFARAASQPRLL